MVYSKYNFFQILQLHISTNNSKVGSDKGVRIEKKRFLIGEYKENVVGL